MNRIIRIKLPLPEVFCVPRGAGSPKAAAELLAGLRDAYRSLGGEKQREVRDFLSELAEPEQLSGGSDSMGIKTHD